MFPVGFSCIAGNINSTFRRFFYYICGSKRFGMKKFVILLVLLIVGFLASAEIASAQIAPSEYSRRGIRLTQDKHAISWEAQDSILAVTGLEKEWRTGAHLRAWGMGSWITGTALAVTGTGVFIVYGAAAMVGMVFAAPLGGADSVAESFGPYMGLGVGMGLTGIVMVAAGIPLHCVGAAKLRNSVKQINSYTPKPEPELELGFTPCGVGLTYRF